jgi:cytochrome c oxidase cbb3-type subunit 3
MDGALPVAALRPWPARLYRAGHAVAGDAGAAGRRRADAGADPRRQPGRDRRRPRAYALAGGRIAFATSCAGCHGSGGQGATGGFPSLADDDWLYGGSFDAIHTSITAGVRNGEHPDARGVAMPAFLAAGLNWAQINQVADHVLTLSTPAGAVPAETPGAVLYAENCAACHGERGEGNRDLGSPRLNDRIWLYGGDKASIVRTIAYSRAGVMPAWAGRLDPATINMLTVYVHALGGGEQ